MQTCRVAVGVWLLAAGFHFAGRVLPPVKICGNSQRVVAEQTYFQPGDGGEGKLDIIIRNRGSRLVSGVSVLETLSRVLARPIYPSTITNASDYSLVLNRDMHTSVCISPGRTFAVPATTGFEGYRIVVEDPK